MAEHRNAFFILGDQTTRKTLTGSYSSANTSRAVEIGSVEQVALEVEYTMGSGETSNSIEVRVMFANPENRGSAPSTWNAATWYQQVSESTSAGDTTVYLQAYSFDAVSAAGTYDRFHIDIPVDSRFMQVSVKETGIASNGGSASVKLVLSESKT